MVFVVPIAIGGYIATSGSFASSVPTDAVQLTLSKSQYKVGEEVSFVLANTGEEAVYVGNNCPNEPLGVYRFVDNEWVRIHDKRDASACAGQKRQITVEAGRHVGASYKYWPDLYKQPGRYKVVAELNGTDVGPSQEFEVVE